MLTDVYLWRGREVRWTALGSGPPVVLCHGTPWSSALWASCAQALAPFFTVYLWDMPGYGVSSKRPEHRVSLDVQGQLFAELVEHWRLDAPQVVAHDFGGAVALRAHLLHGARMGSLALVDVVALSPWGSDFFRLVHDHDEVFVRLPDAVHEGVLRAYIAGAAHHDIPPTAMDALVAPWLGAEGKPAFYRQIAQADERCTDELEPLYPNLRLPVLVVWGRDDAWIPLDRAHRLHGLIAGSRLQVVADAGHLIHLDQPAALAATLTHWLHLNRPG